MKGKYTSKININQTAVCREKFIGGSTSSGFSFAFIIRLICVLVICVCANNRC